MVERAQEHHFMSLAFVAIRIALLFSAHNLPTALKDLASMG
jgi:Sec-independent protein translocase protein TatA